MDMPYGIWVLYILRILSERTCCQLKSATPTERLTIKSTASASRFDRLKEEGFGGIGSVGTGFRRPQTVIGAV